MPTAFNTLGINLNETKIQIVEILNEGNKFFAENIDEEYFEEVLNFNEKEGKIIELLQSAFNEILLRTKLKSEKVFVALPPKVFKVFQIPLEKRLSQQDKNKYLVWEFKQLFPYLTHENYVLKYFPVNTNNLSNSNDVCVFALNKNLPKALEKFLTRNNLFLKSVDNAHIASLNILQGTPWNNSTQLNVYVGEKFLSLIFMRENSILLIKTIEYENVSEIPSKIEEALKVTELFGLNRYDFSEGFISGELTPETLLTRLKEELDITLKKLNPFSSLQVREGLQNSPFVTEKYNSLTSACGIALRLE